MDKREIFDALGDFSNSLLDTIAEVEMLKKHLQSVIDENVQLRLENMKLREHLEQEEESSQKGSSRGRENLIRVYEDGFHICNAFYGQRLENGEGCLSCDEILYRK